MLLALRRGLVYEGELNFLRAIHPIPILTRASFAANPAPDFGFHAGKLFREDSFDPVTRIRRGRMYAYGRNQTWLSSENVHNYPFGPLLDAGPVWQPVWYQPLEGNKVPKATDPNDAFVQLGDNGFQTSWRIVDVEHIHTGDFLFTLRAISLFGALPPLRDDLRTKDGVAVNARPVTQALEKLVDAFRVQQPVPIVDVSRETARIILTAWIGSDAETKDLGGVIETIPDPKKLAKWAASIISRLHPRGKSAEVEKQASKGVELRPVIDEDAELCLHLTGLLLREIGWAKP